MPTKGTHTHTLDAARIFTIVLKLKTLLSGAFQLVARICSAELRLVCAKLGAVSAKLEGLSITLAPSRPSMLKAGLVDFPFARCRLWP